MVLSRSLLAGVAAVALCGLAGAQGPRPLGPPAGAPLRPPANLPRPEAKEGEVDDVRPWLLRLTGKQIQKDIDPEVLKDLMEKLKKLPKEDRPDPKQIEKLLKDNPKFKDPEFLKQLEKLVGDQEFPDNLEGKVPKFDPAEIKDQQGLKKKFEEVIENAKQDNPQGKLPDPKLGQMNPDQGKGPDGKLPDSAAAENEWVKWLEKNFKDSPAAADAMKDLVAALEKPDGKGLFDDLPEFKNQGWKDLDGLGKNTGNDWKFKPPDLGGNKVTSPNIGGGGSSGPGWGGSGSAPSASGVGLEGGGSALAVIAGIVGALVLGVLLFRKWRLDRELRAGAGGTVRADIDFDAIRSREELVKVFDAVSLGRCGEEARNWNHRVIAEQIAETQPAHADPADEVAGLYERARYAPQEEDLTAGEFATARQDLRVIAGARA